MDTVRSLHPTQDSSISLLKRPNCAQLFFIYPGKMRAMLGLDPLSFMKLGLRNRNLAFVRDPKAAFFEDGISKELPTLDAVLDWHALHIDSHPGLREVYCVGNSSGGYAAMMFGHLLGVRRVWAFAPAGQKRVTLLADLLSEWNGVTEYHVFYSEAVPFDRMFAEAIAECPGVILHPSPATKGDDHRIMKRMAERGELSGVFPPPFRAVEA